MAIVMLRTTYSQKNTIKIEKAAATGLYVVWRSIIIYDQPYKVKVWKTVNIDQSIVSKLRIEKFGFAIPRPQINPYEQVLPYMQRSSDRFPVET